MTISKPDKKPKCPDRKLKRKAPKSAFKPGFDPRRNMGGNLNAKAQSYEIRFRNASASGLLPEDFAAIVIEDVRRHRPGAKEFFADRVMGKVTQPLSGNFDIGLKAKDIFEAMRKADEELTLKDFKG